MSRRRVSSHFNATLLPDEQGAQSPSRPQQGNTSSAFRHTQRAGDRLYRLVFPVAQDKQRAVAARQAVQRRSNTGGLNAVQSDLFYAFGGRRQRRKDRSGPH